MNAFRLVLPISLSLAVCTSVPVTESQDSDLIRAYELRDFGLTVRDPLVQYELELSDDQIRVMEAISKWYSDSARRALLTGSSQGDFSDQQERLYEELRAKLNNVLLPHQLVRLGQLNLQRAVGQNEPSFGLLHKSIAPHLDLTADQRDAIESKAEEIQADLQEAIAELQEKIIELKKDARKDLMQLLTPEQREVYFQLLGDDPVLGELWSEHPSRQAFERIREIRQRDNDNR